jgi:hypothetical protein
MCFDRRTPWWPFWRWREKLPAESVVSRFDWTPRATAPTPNMFTDMNMGDISVFETQFMEEQEKWDIGRRMRQKSLHGRCDVTVERANSIAVMVDGQNTKLGLLTRRAPILKFKKKYWSRNSWWHANIENCPKEDSIYKLMTLAFCEPGVTTYVPCSPPQKPII